METFVAWLSDTPISHAFGRQAPWAWPLFETLHFFGLCLLVGIAGFFDLRLLGVIKGVSVSAAKQFMPWAIAGFFVNLITGTYFFIAQPTQYLDNRAFAPKLVFLMVAGLNAIFFERALGPKALTVGPNEDTPTSFKIVGGISLFSWFAVLYFGRMLAVFGIAN